MSETEPEKYPDLKPAYATEDDDGHWYVIPLEMKEEFNNLLEKSGYGSCDEWQENEAKFIEKFSGYMTGGDLNLKPLYAEFN